MKKIIIWMNCLLAFTAMHPVYPMGKTFAKKAFEKTCTALGWGIAAGPLWLDAAGGSILLAADTLSDKPLVLLRSPGLPDQPIFVPVSKEMDALIRQEVRAVGVNHPVEVKTFNPQTIHHPAVQQLKAAVGHSPAFALHKTIFITDEQSPCENEVVHLNTHNQQEKDSVFRYLVQHEANHVKNQDSFKRLPVAATIPFITHYGIKLLTRGRVPQSTLGHLKKIPAGIGKLFANTSMFSAFVKYTEQKADDGVVDTKDILTGGFIFNNANHQFCMQHLKQYDPEFNLNNFSSRLMYTAMAPLHPTPLARAQKFEERLKQLEATEAAKISAQGLPQKKNT